MTLNERLLTDLDWLPSGRIIESAPIDIIPTDAPVGLVESYIKATAEVRALINDMLYATAIDDDGKPVLEDIGGYRVDNFPKGHSLYQLVDLKKQERVKVPGFSATFKYTTGKKTLDGLDEARLEYTTWHDPKSGLTILTSLHAYQIIEENSLSIALNIATPDGLERAMTTKIPYPGGVLGFNSEGVLEGPITMPLLPPHEIEQIYQMITKRNAKVNALDTALALVKAFPNDDPLLMHTNIQYNQN